MKMKWVTDLKKNAVRRRVVSEKTGSVEYDEFWPSKSKPILDEIDRVLAPHYGFTDDELDFTPSTKLLGAGINYDIKYRMGQDAAVDDEE